MIIAKNRVLVFLTSEVGNVKVFEIGDEGKRNSVMLLVDWLANFNWIEVLIGQM
jgi:hypothetical protein